MNPVKLPQPNKSATKPATAKPTANAADRLTDLLNKDISIFSKGKPGDKFKEALYSELGMLLKEGIDIKTSIEILLDDHEPGEGKQAIQAIHQKIIKGTKLAEALKENEIFTPYEFQTIRIGEESGRLIQVLAELAIFYQRKIKQQKQLMGALTYPLLVTGVAAGAVFFMMNFIVPMFAEIFKRFNGELPFLTQLIINVSQFLSSYAWIMGLFIAVVVGLIYSQRKTADFEKYSALMLLKIPVVGVLIHKIYLARFCQSMALLLESKITIVEALNLVENMISFYPIQQSISTITKKIILGESLHQSLAMYPIYPARMIKMIKIAEEVNKTDVMFHKLSTQLSNEVEHQLELVNKLLEPILIVVLGAVIGVILIAMYMPLFQLGSQIQ